MGCSENPLQSLKKVKLLREKKKSKKLLAKEVENIIRGFFCALRASCVHPAGRWCSAVAGDGAGRAHQQLLFFLCKEEKTHILVCTQGRKKTQIHDLRFSFVGGSHQKALLEEKGLQKKLSA